MPCLPHEECGQRESDDGEHDAEIERLRTKAVACGNPARRQCTGRNRHVSGELIQAHRQPASLRTDEVNLHDDGRRPGQTLADAEQEIRKQDPVPARRPHEEDGHRDGDQPSGHQHVLATYTVRQSAGAVICDRLRHPEHDDEREHRGTRGEVELLRRDRREDAAFQADHGADKGIHDDEQRELTEVFAETKAHGAGHWRQC